MFTLLQKRFGPYPFPKDGFKIVQTPYVGMEHQSAIAYGGEFSNSGHYFTLDAFDYILLHETAHQWWGNSITACDLAETWLHEGFATYSEALYLEEYMGKHHYQTYLDYLATGIENRFPLVGPRGVNYHSPWNSDIYGKGAWVLHSLRSAMGQDSVFFGILRQWSMANQRQIVCTDDFISLVEDATGKNWTPFFQQYLYHSAPPILEYFSDGEQFYYRWNGVPEGFEMEVRFIGPDWGMRVDASTRIANLPITTEGPLLPDNHFSLFQALENPLLPLLMELE
jgi:aminopeptidase N